MEQNRKEKAWLYVWGGTALLMLGSILSVMQNVRMQRKHLYRLKDRKSSDWGLVHFSVDDTIDIFRDLTVNEKKYGSIFENKTLGKLKFLHDFYGLRVTFYCFYNFGGFSLRNCTDRFSEEFKENLDWMRFGFHAYCAQSYRECSTAGMLREYGLMERELMRITKSTEKQLSHILRLDRFSGTKEQIKGLSEKYNVAAFLAADDAKRQSYDLSERENQTLYAKGWLVKDGIIYLRTDVRLENQKSGAALKQCMEENKDKVHVVFTHETELNKVWGRLRVLCEYAYNRGYGWM